MWVHACSVWLYVPPCTVAHQTPLAMEFSRQEYWSGLPPPTLEDLPHTGIKPMSPASAGGFFQRFEIEFTRAQLKIEWEGRRTKKEYIQYDSIYIKLSKMQTNLWWQRAADQGLPREGLGVRRQGVGRKHRLGECSWMCSLSWIPMSKFIKFCLLNIRVSFYMPIIHH